MILGGGAGQNVAADDGSSVPLLHPTASLITVTE
jgi:hypothetical protein